MNEEKLILKIMLTAEYSQTISEISDKLFISQSYVSRLLKSIENKYQLTFIDRNTKPIRITSAGKLLISNLQSIVTAKKTMDQQFDDLHRKEIGKITIGIDQPFLKQDIINQIIELHNSFPEVQMRIIDKNSNDSENQLLDGNIDILIGRKWNNPLLTITNLKSPQLYLLIPSTCPLFRKDQLYCTFTEDNLSTLNGSNYIGLSENSSFQKMANESFESNGIFVNEIFEFPDAITCTKTAYKYNATTITTENISELFLPNDSMFNLMKLPEHFVHSDFALSYLRNASENIISIGNHIINDINLKNKKTDKL